MRRMDWCAWLAVLAIGCGGAEEGAQLPASIDASGPDTQRVSPDTGRPGSGSLCTTDPSALAVVDGEDLHLIGTGGTTSVALPGLDGVPGGAATEIRLATGAGRLAVAVNWTAGVDRGVVLSAFDAGGAVAWTTAGAGHHVVSMWLGAQGLAAVRYHYGAPPATDGLLVGPGGQITELPGFRPLGPPHTDGAVPGWSSAEGDDEVLGWRASDGTFAAAGLAPEPQIAWMLDGDLVFLSGGKTARWLHWLTASGEGGFHILWDVEAEAGQVAIEARRGPWLLLADTQTGRRWRVDQRDGSAVEVATALPDGREPFVGCAPSPFALDRSGRVLLSLRDDARARAYRHDPVAQTWDPVGHPLTGVEAVSVRALADTPVLESLGFNDTFCPAAPFTELEDESLLDGAAVQVVGPEDTVVLPQGTLVGDATPDGLCVLYRDADQALHVLDLATGGVADGLPPGSAIWIPEAGPLP